MEEALTRKIDEIRDSAKKLVDMGWAESFFGNISVLMDPIEEDLEVLDTYQSPVEVQELIGLDILITRASSTMEEVANSPEAAVGLYRIGGKGLELLWGNGPPSSEISSHLLAYSTGRGQAIIHCHMDDVWAVTSSVIRVNPPPSGIGIVGELEPGSIELAEATMDALHDNDTIIWRNHGAISMTDGLSKCLEKLTGLEGYLKSIPP